VQLGVLAVLRGKLDEARALLEEALDLSLAARSTPFVTLCLAAYARLALAEGNPERAAWLKGAAEGLRQRVGLPAWPDLRRLEERLAAQIRQELSAAQFDQAFSAGSGLTQRQAIDMVRDQHGTGPGDPEPSRTERGTHSMAPGAKTVPALPSCPSPPGQPGADAQSARTRQ
jgi:hypothetical protein